MAAVAGVDDVMKIVTLTKQLSFSQKTGTLYSYFKIYKMPDEVQQRIKSILGQAQIHHQLRTDIAHALWFQGKRPNSIRAGYLDTRHGQGRFVGFDDKELDYTADELGTAANHVNQAANDLLRYLRDSGLNAAIARNIEASNSRD